MNNTMKSLNDKFLGVIENNKIEWLDEQPAHQPIAVGDVEKAAENYVNSLWSRYEKNYFTKRKKDGTATSDMLLAESSFKACAEWQAKQQPINKVNDITQEWHKDFTLILDNYKSGKINQNGVIQWLQGQIISPLQDAIKVNDVEEDIWDSLKDFKHDDPSKINDIEDKNLKCEGSCEQHFGKVQKVIVSGEGFNSMKFNYCNAAIKEDINRGFIVILDNK